MSKRKHGPRLFELLGEDRGEAAATLEIPRWWSGRERKPQAPAVVRPPQTEEVDESERLRMAPAPDNAERSPFFELHGDRIRLSFTSTTAAVALFIAMAVLVASFELGSRSGHRNGLAVGYEVGRESYAAEAISEIEAARAEPPATHVVESLLDEPQVTPVVAAGGGGQPTSKAAPSGWIGGHTYIVAQEFAADRPEHGKKAQAFLLDHGIETDLVRLRSGAVQLITTQGYNHADPSQKKIAAQLLEKIHAIGAKYYAGGGGYKLEGYFKTLKGENW